MLHGGFIAKASDTGNHVRQHGDLVLKITLSQTTHTYGYADLIFIILLLFCYLGYLFEEEEKKMIEYLHDLGLSGSFFKIIYDIFLLNFLHFTLQ